MARVVVDSDPTRWMGGAEMAAGGPVSAEPIALVRAPVATRRSWLAANGLSLAVAGALAIGCFAVASWLGAGTGASQGVDVRWGDSVYRCSYDADTAFACHPTDAAPR